MATFLRQVMILSAGKYPTKAEHDKWKENCVPTSSHSKSSPLFAFRCYQHPTARMNEVIHLAHWPKHEECFPVLLTDASSSTQLNWPFHNLILFEHGCWYVHTSCLYVLASHFMYWIVWIRSIYTATMFPLTTQAQLLLAYISASFPLCLNIAMI